MFTFESTEIQNLDQALALAQANYNNARVIAEKGETAAQQYAKELYETNKPPHLVTADERGELDQALAQTATDAMDASKTIQRAGLAKFVVLNSNGTRTLCIANFSFNNRETVGYAPCCKIEEGHGYLEISPEEAVKMAAPVS